MVWRHCPRDLRSYPWGVPNLVETNHVGAQSVILFFCVRLARPSAPMKAKLLFFILGSVLKHDRGKQFG